MPRASILSVTLALAAPLGCAASSAETKPAESAPERPAQRAASELGLIDTDVRRIEEISRLDQQNQGLKQTVAELEAKLAAALKGEARAEDKAAAPPPSPVSTVDSPGRHRVQVRLPGELLFEPGSARISRGGRRLLGQITGVLKDTPSRRIEVAGHTDSSPTSKKYEDNWQLSGERARRVVTFLASQGVDPHHLVAIGYGDSEPLDPGQTPEARAKNRRVEIFIEPRE